MRILYGVVGEGMGHATRSRVVLEHLLGQGHELHIMASGRARDFLAKRFTIPDSDAGPSSASRIPADRPSAFSVDRPSHSGVRPISSHPASASHPPSKVQGIHGFSMITEENRVRLGKTVLSNVLSGTTGLPKNIAAYFALLTEFRPEVVISDFESWTYLFAKTHGLPILSIDNMQIINRCAHEPDITAGHEASFQLAKTFVKSKLPFCNEYFVTTFFRPPLRKPDTRLFPPILRPEILEAKRTRGEHLLVYQTAEGNDELATTLIRSGFPARVYGMRRQITADVVEGNLTYRPFSETGFIDDLASSRAVIAGGGFTLMGEAVYLRKPMLSVPLAAQFEQVMNARYLQKVHYGRMAESLADPREIETFLRELPTFETALESYDQDGNHELFGAVDEWLDKAEAGVA
jgi:uncharacterized protein (TIGR00661 family)